MNETEIYNAALAKWGVNLQIIVAIEELAELSQALAKYMRHGLTPEDVGSLSPIEDEIADVQIMLDQLKLAFPYAFHEQAKEAKLKNLKKLLNI